MEKTIYEKFDKTKIGQLPRLEPQGRIIVVLSAAEADKAVDWLMTQPILGIDTETRPTFKRGQARHLALLQIASPDTCFLFRLNRFDITDKLKALLEDTAIPKVGLSLRDDLRGLRQLREFTPGKYIELQDEVTRIGIRDASLQKIYANLFGKRISKAQQLSNWEADTLSPAQQHYAATDAWACIHIYRELHSLLTTHAYTLVEERLEIRD